MNRSIAVPKLQMIGCSHRDAGVEFRERIALSDDAMRTALSNFADRYPDAELVVLSTCNRVELYAGVSGASGSGGNGAGDRGDTPPPDAVSPTAEELSRFLAETTGASPDEIIERMIYRSDVEAITHLFTVAASLDSMVVGESQILSQVKQAYDLACDRGSAGPLTHAVFQAATRAAKRVQTETKIGRRRTSVPSVAVGEIVPEVFDSLADKVVVVCGAGEMGAETLRYLRDGGATDIRVLNRSYERAVDLARSHGGRAERWQSLHEMVIAADVLIGTTSAPSFILDAATFESLASRRSGVLLMLDLAVPRDFDPAIGQSDGVYLYSVDDLQTACRRNQALREKEWPRAQSIIDEETGKLIESLRHRSTGPVITRLRSQAAEIKALELKRLMNKLSNSPVDPAAAAEIEKSFDRLINKLLHPPLASIKDDAADGHSKGLVEALKHLFNLGDS